MSIASLGIRYKLPWFCLLLSKSKVPTSHCCIWTHVDLTWAFGDTFSRWCGAVTELSKHPAQSSIEMSLSIDSLWALPSSTLSRVFTYTHSDGLLGLIVFPVFFAYFLQVSTPFLVTMATGETQSQYLLAASVTQPSTRIAGSCFCVCLTFPSLKSNASGQGRCARSVWFGTPPLRQSSGIFFVYLCTCVCARVSLSALQRCTNKFSLCKNSQGGEKKDIL